MLASLCISINALLIPDKIPFYLSPGTLQTSEIRMFSDGANFRQLFTTSFNPL